MSKTKYICSEETMKIFMDYDPNLTKEHFLDFLAIAKEEKNDE